MVYQHNSILSTLLYRPRKLLKLSPSEPSLDLSSIAKETKY